jgi:hypothetical protein
MCNAADIARGRPGVKRQNEEEVWETALWFNTLQWMKISLAPGVIAGRVQYVICYPVFGSDGKVPI